MTRRILIALITLIVGLVVGAAVPLGMKAADQDRQAFYDEVGATARLYAALSQVPLSRPPSDATAGNASLLPINSLTRKQGWGAQVVPCKPTLTVRPTACILNTAPTAFYLNQEMPRGNWRSLIDQAYRQATIDKLPALQFQTTPSLVVTAVGVDKNGVSGVVRGVVLVARSSAPLDSTIRTLWLLLASIGMAAIVAASLLAIWLARWVSQPLAGLDTAARRLADGNLGVRAATNQGPPELRRLARTFNTMAGRLENLVHGSRAVLADVSHQLRTPLAALRLRLDFLAADAAEADPALAAELAGAQDELTRLNRLVDGLLAVARAENVQPQPEVIDVALAAAERVAAWLPVAEDRGIDLIDDIELSDGDPLGPPPVLGWLGDGHLEQVLDNLIANALDAVPSGGRITVSGTLTGDRVHMTVADTGPGMSDEDKERAFLRFTSGRPAGTGLGGTGLGMAIVHRLVTSNGGTAELTDTPGGGLTVVLEFPAAASSAPAAAELPVPERL